MKNKILISLLVLVLIINFIFMIYYLKSVMSGGVVSENILVSQNNFSEKEENSEEVEETEESIEEVVEDNKLKYISESGFVTKIIDGDTVVINGENVRLLGIDADEKGYECYKEARDRLAELISDKHVKLERDGENKDHYGRYLRYIFVDDINVNLKLVEEGLAIARFFPDNKKYKEEILEAEIEARKNNLGCKWKDVEYEDWENGGFIDENGLSLGAVGACNAGNYLGQEKTVEGRIVDSYRYENISIFLNFEKPYPNSCFTAVIWASDWENFPENPEYYYYDKRVRITGTIEVYKGRFEIILKNKEQIEIIS